MSLSYQNILQVRVTFSPRATILEEIKKYLNHSEKSTRSGSTTDKKPLVITTPNPEQIVFAQTHQVFRDILNRAYVALPDGVGIVLASRFLQKSTGGKSQTGVHERIPGVEFTEDLVRIAGDQGIRIGLIGGSDGLAVQALECLQAIYPGLSGWAMDGPELVLRSTEDMEGPSVSYWEDLAEKIRSTQTQIVFVGLGAPKQEYFIETLSRQLSVTRLAEAPAKRVRPPIVLMSVGGSFDLLTGRLKRAPVFIRSIGFEWAWRLAQEPWRIQRQTALIQFVWLVLQKKFFLAPDRACDQ
ncbi:MAG: WecB/TagA/CpsF family glycosyltransferase [Patescibacteria group bacterium]